MVNSAYSDFGNKNVLPLIFSSTPKQNSLIFISLNYINIKLVVKFLLFNYVQSKHGQKSKVIVYKLFPVNCFFIFSSLILEYHNVHRCSY